MPGLEIDDAEPAHAESDPSAQIEPLVVGAAMGERAAHRRDFVAADGAAVEIDDSRDAAHAYTAPRRKDVRAVLVKTPSITSMPAQRAYTRVAHAGSTASIGRSRYVSDVSSTISFNAKRLSPCGPMATLGRISRPSTSKMAPAPRAVRASLPSGLAGWYTHGPVRVAAWNSSRAAQCPGGSATAVKNHQRPAA